MLDMNIYEYADVLECEYANIHKYEYAKIYEYELIKAQKNGKTEKKKKYFRTGRPDRY